jgi:hypothetical protein
MLGGEKAIEKLLEDLEIEDNLNGKSNKDFDDNENENANEGSNQENTESNQENTESNQEKPKTVKRKNWLSKLLHGQILSNTYVRPIIFLSLNGCHSYLPLRVSPKKGNKPICLLRVDGVHWVLPSVGGKDRVTPIPPPILIPRLISRSANVCFAHIKNGQDLYSQSLEKGQP